MKKRFMALIFIFMVFTQNMVINSKFIRKMEEGYPEWSSDNESYKVGTLVQYEGKVYECIYQHNSNVAWTPTDAFTLWKLREDLKPGESGEKTDPDKKDPEKDDDESKYTGGSLPKHTVTGYWHNFLNGSKALKISDVPKYYNVICVAFADSTSKSGEVTFQINPDLASAVGGYTEKEFIQDIKDAKNKGQHVIISVGGAEGTTYINDKDSANNFASSLIKIIEKFGFEGVDIDFEGAAVSGTDYIADALRTVHDHFGDEFIITMAPELYYMQADRMPAKDLTTSYWRLAMEIKDILTICQPQFYNTGSMFGYGGIIAEYPTADFLTSIGTLYLESGLKPQQLGFGLPATKQAAGSGYIEPSGLSTAVKSMVGGTSSGKFKPPKSYPKLRGVMTWSINWDATNSYKWAKEMSSLMDSL